VVDFRRKKVKAAGDRQRQCQGLRRNASARPRSRSRIARAKDWMCSSALSGSGRISKFKRSFRRNSVRV
jgi:hypothetical protein